MNTIVTWHYLPELPESGKEVLIAFKWFDIPMQGFYSEQWRQWKGSQEVRETMIDGFVQDSKFLMQEDIYAWAELPTKPPMDI